jgi:hypothetical protein
MKDGFIKKADILLAVFLLIAGFGSMLLLNKEVPENAFVNITVDGKLLAEFPLDKDVEYEVKTEYGRNLIVIDNGSVEVSEADCRGRDCVKFGKISSQGQLIMCLPHRLLITIKGGGEVDSVVY